MESNMIKIDHAHASKLARWDVRQRLILLETTLLMVGWIRVNSLMETFGISRAQASKDFQLYRLIKPNNLKYNLSDKYYEVGDDFTPLFLTGKTSELLSVFQSPKTPNPPVLSLSAYLPNAAALKPLDREVDLMIFNRLSCATYNHQKVKILYQSLSDAQPSTHIISPHAIIFSGYRWHIRAYSETRQEFRDFLFARIKGLPELVSGAAISESNDIDWQQEVVIKIGVHPGLPENHKQVIADDYGMVNQQLEVSIKRALVVYFLKLMHIEPNREHPDPKVQQIIVLNKDEIKSLMWVS